MKKTARGVAEMTAAMTISGTIGMFVVLSDQPVMTTSAWGWCARYSVIA